jgi:protease-4
MKQFFKTMFASALGGLLAIGLVIVIFIITLVGMAASFDHSPEYVPKPQTVLKLSLSGILQETAEENPFSFLSFSEMVQTLSVKDIIKSIRIAKNNYNIVGIYIEAGTLSAGTASIDMIRRELIEFKTSGKFIVAYGDSYSQGCYYLCSTADKMFLNPLGSVDIHGLVSETTFYKGMLNKIGVEMEIFKVGTYKGAVEMFMLDKLSDENKEQITSYQQSIWSNITGGIAESRSLSPEDVNNFADRGYILSPAGKVVELGFIDELKYKPEAEEYVKELAGQTGDKLKTTGPGKMKNLKESLPATSSRIAVLYAEGEIVSEASSSLYDGKLITEKMAEELAKLRKDDKVKAVVMRVNSPGGSAYISEQIWKEVTEIRKVKPIVVSMGNVAASGGYYISCAADKIIAEHNTITGSIGVFGIIPNAAGLYKKLDITSETVKTNNYGDLFDLSRPFRPDEKRLMQAYVENMYDIFTTRCADGRGKTKEEIDNVGQGRVWTGEQALERGLVDKLGGLDEAVGVAAELAGLTDYSLVHISDNKDLFHELFAKQLESMKISLVKSVIGEEYKYLKALNDMKNNTGIRARLLHDVQPL